MPNILPTGSGTISTRSIRTAENRPVPPPGAAVDRPPSTLSRRGEREMKPFELAAAVGRQGFSAAVRTINALFSVKTSSCRLSCRPSAGISGRFSGSKNFSRPIRTSPAVCGLLNGNRTNPGQTETGMAIGKAAGTPPRRAEEAENFSRCLSNPASWSRRRQFSEDELAQILGWLLDSIPAFKTGRIEADRAGAADSSATGSSAAGRRQRSGDDGG